MFELIFLTSSITLFFLVLIIDLVHYGAMYSFLYKVHHKGWKKNQELYEPKAAVLLALRGADPFLKYCIQGLLRQDYPNYTVFFMVDSDSDPAIPVVVDILAQETKVRPRCKCEIVIVDEHFDSCALKCNSLAHVIEKLDESFQVIAILNADTRPFPTWLRQLVEPLSDQRFAATSGLRWYVPEHSNWGSLVRMLWNVAAVNQMAFSQIPWGGSFALRREVFFEGGLLERWKNTLTDDVPTYPVVRAMGAQVLVNPSLLMVNREFCHLASFYPWVKRQILLAKLYHPKWWVIVGQAFFLFMLPATSFVLAIYGLCLKNWTLFYWNIASFLLYVIGVFGAFVIMDGSVRRYLRKTGENIPRQTVGGLVKTSVSIILTQFVYAMAICGVFRMKKVTWRGIMYQIGPGERVQMEKFVPYAEIVKATKATQENDSMESL